jgi:TIR domain
MVPIQHTTEFAATSPHVIGAIVDELRPSPRKLMVFEAVYSGGNKPKNANLLASGTGLSEVVVLQLATPMAHKQYFEQARIDGRVAFRKYPHINAVKYRILRSAKNPNKARPEKVENRGSHPHGRRRTTPRMRRGKALRRAGRRRFDIFVSHATEDKKFVTPLVKALENADISVWYDSTMLGWGDDLRRSIDRGLANSRYGIVVFSKAFLAGKHWTEHELSGLFAKERLGKKVILPIWHKITRRDLLEYSPAFADRIAKVSQRDSVSNIVESLKALLKKR